MYNLKIGVIKSIDDVLVNGVSVLDEVGLTEIQLNCCMLLIFLFFFNHS